MFFRKLKSKVKKFIVGLCFVVVIAGSLFLFQNCANIPNQVKNSGTKIDNSNISLGAESSKVVNPLGSICNGTPYCRYYINDEDTVDANIRYLCVSAAENIRISDTEDETNSSQDNSWNFVKNNFANYIVSPNPSGTILNCDTHSGTVSYHLRFKRRVKCEYNSVSNTATRSMILGDLLYAYFDPTIVNSDNKTDIAHNAGCTGMNPFNILDDKTKYTKYIANPPAAGTSNCTYTEFKMIYGIKVPAHIKNSDDKAITDYMKIINKGFCKMEVKTAIGATNINTSDVSSCSLYEIGEKIDLIACKCPVALPGLYDGFCKKSPTISTVNFVGKSDFTETLPVVDGTKINIKIFKSQVGGSKSLLKYRHKQLNKFIYITEGSESLALDAASNIFELVQILGYVYPADFCPSHAIKIARLFSSSKADHLYISESQLGNTNTNGYTNEGVKFCSASW